MTWGWVISSLGSPLSYNLWPTTLHPLQKRESVSGNWYWPRESNFIWEVLLDPPIEQKARQGSVWRKVTLRPPAGAGHASLARCCCDNKKPGNPAPPVSRPTLPSTSSWQKKVRDRYNSETLPKAKRHELLFQLTPLSHLDSDSFGLIWSLLDSLGVFWTLLNSNVCIYLDSWSHQGSLANHWGR